MLKKIKKTVALTALSCFLCAPAYYAVNINYAEAAVNNEPKVEQQHDNFKNTVPDKMPNNKTAAKNDGEKTDDKSDGTASHDNKNNANAKENSPQSQTASGHDNDSDKNAQQPYHPYQPATQQDKNRGDKDETPDAYDKNSENCTSDKHGNGGISTNIVVGNVVGAIISKSI